MLSEYGLTKLVITIDAATSCKPFWKICEVRDMIGRAAFQQDAVAASTCQGMASGPMPMRTAPWKAELAKMGGFYPPL